MTFKISCIAWLLMLSVGCKQRPTSNADSKAVSGPGTGKSFTVIFEGKSEHSMCKSTCSADPSDFQSPDDFTSKCQGKNNYGVTQKEFKSMTFLQSIDGKKANANLNEMIALFVSKGPEVFSPEDIAKVNPDAVPAFKNAVFQLGNEITRRKKVLADCDFKAYVEKLGTHMAETSTVSVDSDAVTTKPTETAEPEKQDTPATPAPDQKVGGTICAATYRGALLFNSCRNFTANTAYLASQICVKFAGPFGIPDCSPEGFHKCFQYKSEVRKTNANTKFYGQGLKNNLAFDTAWERIDGIMVNLYGNQVTPIDCSTNSDKCNSSCKADY